MSTPITSSGRERRSKRSKSSLIQQHSRKAFRFFFDIREDKMKATSLDEIVTKALALGGEIVEESEEADFIVSNHGEGVYEDGGLIVSDKFIEKSYSKGSWLSDYSSFLLTSSCENSKKKQKKSKYSDEEIRNLMNFVYEHNKQSFDDVDRQIFESMAERPEFEGRSAVGLSRKFSQLSKSALNTFLRERDDVVHSSHCVDTGTSVLDSLISSIPDTEIISPTIDCQTSPPPQQPIEELPPDNNFQTTPPEKETPITIEDQILLELKAELTKEQIFSFMCEIIGFPIENKTIVLN